MLTASPVRWGEPPPLAEDVRVSALKLKKITLNAPVQAGETEECRPPASCRKKVLFPSKQATDLPSQRVLSVRRTAARTHARTRWLLHVTADRRGRQKSPPPARRPARRLCCWSHDGIAAGGEGRGQMMSERPQHVLEHQLPIPPPSEPRDAELSPCYL